MATPLMSIMRPSHKQHVGLLPDDVSRGPKLSKSLSCVASPDSAQPISSYHIDALASRLSPYTRTSAVTNPRHRSNLMTTYVTDSAQVDGLSITDVKLLL